MEIADTPRPIERGVSANPVWSDETVCSADQCLKGVVSTTCCQMIVRGIPSVQGGVVLSASPGCPASRTPIDIHSLKEFDSVNQVSIRYAELHAGQIR